MSVSVSVSASVSAMHRFPPPPLGPDFDILERIEDLEDHINELYDALMLERWARIMFKLLYRHSLNRRAYLPVL